MESKIPTIFKPITPFIRRAEELDKDQTRPESRLVAYYCRQFAMELGISLRDKDSSDDSTLYLLSLMDKLEQEKKAMPVFSQEEGKQICEAFAYEIFSKADDKDRSGTADKNTARTFYAAGSFFDILKQFGDLSEEVREKCRYCKWKAADILKAIKEGRQPSPGAPGETIDQIKDTEVSATATSVESIPEAPTAPPVLSPTFAERQLPSVPDQFPNMADASFLPSQASGSKNIPNPDYGSNNFNYHVPPPLDAYPQTYPQENNKSYHETIEQPRGMQGVVKQSSGLRSQQKIDDATELCKFAIAALKTKEVDLAVDRLEKALQSLRG